jgi:sulfotransferase 6B1
LDEPRLRRFLGGCPQGMFVTAHATFHPVLRDLVKELQFKQIILLRDPRDAVVSSMFFTKREPWLQHHKYYTEALESDEERIMATIRGFGPDVATDHPRASIRERFEGYIPWLDDPSTLVVRFEDLIGQRGGGVSEKQLDEIERIGAFVERPLSREQTQQIAQKMYSKGSLTFRKGIAGDWRNHFTEDHRRAFKEVAGDILIRLGYEKDMAW